LVFTTDAKLLVATKGIRGFGFGFLSISAVVYLHFIGFNPLSIGIVISLASLGSSLDNVLVSKYADRVGRKRSLLILSVVSSVSSLVLVVSTNFYLISLAFLTGGLSITGSGLGPLHSVEQASLPDTTSRENRNYLFSFYNVSGSLLTTLGSLFAGAQGIFESFHLQTIDSLRVFFLLYAASGLLLIALYARLSNKIEAPRMDANIQPQPDLHLKQYSTIAKLSALFGMDMFGSGFVGQSILALWFTTRFDVGSQDLAVLFFFSVAIVTISYTLAARFASRLGLVRSMVLTQVPANIFLVLMAFSPSYLEAVAFFLARAPFSQMDVPLRDAYIVSVVEPNQRTSAAALTGISRNTAQTVSPSIAAYMIQVANYSAPLLVAGGVKLVYDLLLYLGFRYHER